MTKLVVIRRKILSPFLGLVGALGLFAVIFGGSVFTYSNETLKKWRLQKEGRWSEDGED